MTSLRRIVRWIYKFTVTERRTSDCINLQASTVQNSVDSAQISPGGQLLVKTVTFITKSAFKMIQFRNKQYLLCKVSESKRFYPIGTGGAMRTQVCVC